MVICESSAGAPAAITFRRSPFAEVLSKPARCARHFGEPAAMDLTPDQAASVVERHDCPSCDAPAGSGCRTRGGKTAAKYHTPASSSSPHSARNWRSPSPADRHPGRAWKQGPALAIVPAPRTERPVRIGYARTSTARQELASRPEALHRAECHKVFKERISTRVKMRPELGAALTLAHQLKEAAPEAPVIPTVHELKRLARNAAELMTLSTDLQASGIQFELLTGPLTGIYDPTGRTRASHPRSPRCIGHSRKPRPPRMACRAAQACPHPPARGTSHPRGERPARTASGSTPPECRDAVRPAQDQDQVLGVTGCSDGPHGRARSHAPT
ncbi:recombinase family protein [Streptomyces sp. NPDC089795]|uniref:recombinase family protein n=1 Tax=Streptomyces sp. NPDC089795 TaxID=3155297 RepID=UPI00341B0F71